jgi:hypothetical protein
LYLDLLHIDIIEVDFLHIHIIKFNFGHTDVQEFRVIDDGVLAKMRSACYAFFHTILLIIQKNDKKAYDLWFWGTTRPAPIVLKRFRCGLLL